MPGLLSPEDVTVRVLLWIGAPLVIVTIFTSFLAFLGWVSFVKSSVRTVSTAATRTRELIVYWTTELQWAVVRLIAASAIFTALAYSATQLAGVTYEKVGQQRSIAEGMDFDSGYLVSQLLGYQHWTRLSAWTVTGVLVSIFFVNAFTLAGITWLKNVIAFGVAWLVTLPCALFGLLVGFSGIFVLILGLTHSNGYRPSMATLYLLWVVCLVPLHPLWAVIAYLSEQVFD